MSRLKINPSKAPIEPINKKTWRDFFIIKTGNYFVSIARKQFSHKHFLKLSFNSAKACSLKSISKHQHFPVTAPQKKSFPQFSQVEEFSGFLEKLADI
ncbi:MAG TPA: hypothetical protein VGC76_01125 [Pyrinomonadaceae bacterium]